MFPPKPSAEIPSYEVIFPETKCCSLANKKVNENMKKQTLGYQNKIYCIFPSQINITCHLGLIAAFFSKINELSLPILPAKCLEHKQLFKGGSLKINLCTSSFGQLEA